MTKILLVEDDKSLREIYGVRLLAEGYDIVSAGDGEEALAMSIKERPQLIISDVMMPKISGFDMLDILRSTTETRGIKVIMMTALSTEDQRARGEALGADRYLVKSQVGIEDVVTTVHDVLGDKSDYAPQNEPRASQQPRRQQDSNLPPVSGLTQARPQHAYAEPTTSATAAQTPPSNQLPQPTAPFSTQRPANLADRIIHPLERTGNEPDMNSLIAQELSFHEPSSHSEQAVQPHEVAAPATAPIEERSQKIPDTVTVANEQVTKPSLPAASPQQPAADDFSVPMTPTNNNQTAEPSTQPPISQPSADHEPTTLAEAIAQLNVAVPAELSEQTNSQPKSAAEQVSSSTPLGFEETPRPQAVPDAPPKPFFGPAPNQPFVPGPQPSSPPHGPQPPQNQ